MSRELPAELLVEFSTLIGRIFEIVSKNTGVAYDTLEKALYERCDRTAAAAAAVVQVRSEDACTHVFSKGKLIGTRCQGRAARPETKCSKHKKRNGETTRDAETDQLNVYTSPLDGAVASYTDDTDELIFSIDRCKIESS